MGRPPTSSFVYVTLKSSVSYHDQGSYIVPLSAAGTLFGSLPSRLLFFGVDALAAASLWGVSLLFFDMRTATGMMIASRMRTETTPMMIIFRFFFFFACSSAERTVGALPAPPRFSIIYWYSSSSSSIPPSSAKGPLTTRLFLFCFSLCLLSLLSSISLGVYFASSLIARLLSLSSSVALLPLFPLSIPARSPRTTAPPLTSLLSLFLRRSSLLFLLSFSSRISLSLSSIFLLSSAIFAFFLPSLASFTRSFSSAFSFRRTSLR